MGVGVGVGVLDGDGYGLEQNAGGLYVCFPDIRRVP